MEGQAVRWLKRKFEASDRAKDWTGINCCTLLTQRFGITKYSIKKTTIQCKHFTNTAKEEQLSK